MLAMASEAKRRGHRMDVFTHAPLLPLLADNFDRLDVQWFPLNELTRRPLHGVRRLSRYDVLHLNLFAPRSRVALMSYAAWPARVLLVDHFSDSGQGQDGQPNRLRKLIDRATMARVAGLAGVSNYVRDRDMARFGLNHRKARTIYNGVDLTGYAPSSTESGQRARTRIITVAYMIPDKGVDILIRAVARLPKGSIEVFLVGDGPQLEELRSLVQLLQLEDQVRFLGLRNDVPELLGTSDIFVHPCRWADACPLAVIEAGASGLPTVASQIGSLSELVEEGRSGLLFPVGDDDRLASALTRLIDDSDLRASMGRNARLAAVSRFSLQRCVNEHIDWCEQQH